MDRGRAQVKHVARADHLLLDSKSALVQRATERPGRSENLPVKTTLATFSRGFLGHSHFRKLFWSCPDLWRSCVKGPTGDLPDHMLQNLIQGDTSCSEKV